MSHLQQQTQPPKPRSERRILAVDDNPAVLKLIGALFEEEGMTVRLAGCVQDARNLLEAEKGAFDLVLSDISMPGETGFDLLEWIKRPGSPYADLPVLLTTAQLPEAENRLKGLALGAVDYVVRPIELKELVLRAIKAIDHFRQVKGLETMLQDAGNLAMVGRLLAASSHEIKNLATLVKMCSDQLVRALGATGQSGPTGTLLRSLGESSSLLADVARNASSLLDPESAPPRPVEVMELADGVTALMQTRVRPYRLTCEGAKTWALGHDLRLKQVLINLILNAADAIGELDPPEGGRIALRVETQPELVCLRVTDNGIGLTRAGERTEFEAFATTKKLRGGQGLGLWLCARLVAGMGGRLALSSDGVGKGATATLTLAATAAPAAVEPIDLSQYYVD